MEYNSFRVTDEVSIELQFPSPLWIFLLYTDVQQPFLVQLRATTVQPVDICLNSIHPLLQAYTSQIAVLTMLALALGEDSISTRSRREEVIDGLFGLPGG